MRTAERVFEELSEPQKTLHMNMHHAQCRRCNKKRMTFIITEDNIVKNVPLFARNAGLKLRWFTKSVMTNSTLGQGFFI